jgi:hypothetical protein
LRYLPWSRAHSWIERELPALVNGTLTEKQLVGRMYSFSFGWESLCKSLAWILPAEIASCHVLIYSPTCENSDSLVAHV